MRDKEATLQEIEPRSQGRGSLMEKIGNNRRNIAQDRRTKAIEKTRSLPNEMREAAGTNIQSEICAHLKRLEQRNPKEKRKRTIQDKRRKHDAR